MRLVVPPVLAGASIKEDARHHQIKVAAGALGRAAGAELLIEPGIERLEIIENCRSIHLLCAGDLLQRFRPWL